MKDLYLVSEFGSDLIFMLSLQWTRSCLGNVTPFHRLCIYASHLGKIQPCLICILGQNHRVSRPEILNSTNKKNCYALFLHQFHYEFIPNLEFWSWNSTRYKKLLRRFEFPPFQELSKKLNPVSTTFWCVQVDQSTCKQILRQNWNISREIPKLLSICLQF